MYNSNPGIEQRVEIAILRTPGLGSTVSLNIIIEKSGKYSLLSNLTKRNMGFPNLAPNHL